MIYNGFKVFSDLKVNFNTTGGRKYTYMQEKLTEDISYLLDISMKIMSKPQSIVESLIVEVANDFNHQWKSYFIIIFVCFIASLLISIVVFFLSKYWKTHIHNFCIEVF